MSTRKANTAAADRRAARRATKGVTDRDGIVDRVLREAEDALKFGVMLFVRAEGANVPRPAEVKLQALANFEDAVSKIATARMLRAKVGAP